jgi:hypothetical protein
MKTLFSHQRGSVANSYGSCFSRTPVISVATAQGVLPSDRERKSDLDAG